MGSEMKTMAFGACVYKQHAVLRVYGGSLKIIKLDLFSRFFSHDWGSLVFPETRTIDKCSRCRENGRWICTFYICSGGAICRVFMEVEDDRTRSLKLLDGRYASNRTVSRTALQTQLFCINRVRCQAGESPPEKSLFHVTWHNHVQILPTWIE